MPDLSLHGNNFNQGVRFSVHTASRGSAPYLRSPLFGKKPQRGVEWEVEDSRKLIDAQNRPEREFVRLPHVVSISSFVRTSKRAHSSTPGGFAFVVDKGSDAPHLS